METYKDSNKYKRYFIVLRSNRIIGSDDCIIWLYNISMQEAKMNNKIGKMNHGSFIKASNECLVHKK